MSRHISQPENYLKLLGHAYIVSPAFHLLAALFVTISVAGLCYCLTAEVLWNLWNVHRSNLLRVLFCFTLLMWALAVHCSSRRKPVYLIDFACFKPEDDRKVSKHLFMVKSTITNLFSEASLELQKKILERCGIGHESYFPPAVVNVPANPCLDEARMEAETVMFGSLDDLFHNTNVKPNDIRILVVNCSVFCPAPSLTSMIVNRYGMTEATLSYNLGGMGCSAGIIAIEMAKDLLQVHRESFALVVSTENITLNWYRGNDKSMLVSNCLFRMGGAAILLSNRNSDKRRCKYQLTHSVRTHKGGDSKSFLCVQQQEDENGRLGVMLSRELMAVAGDALKANISTLGPLVLPISEQVLFLTTYIGRIIFKLNNKPYIPDFKLAFEHFCIHAGGRAVLNEVEKNLQLPEWHMEPNRMTLYRFGNTSSSSLWYELAYMEAKGRIKRGDRILQIGFGSGFKCNSAVWRARKTVISCSVKNCWSEFIDKFPVPIPTVDKF